MNGFNPEIGLWIANERMQKLHREAALARLARPVDGRSVAPERTARALITRPLRLLGASR